MGTIVGAGHIVNGGEEIWLVRRFSRKFYATGGSGFGRSNDEKFEVLFVVRSFRPSQVPHPMAKQTHEQFVHY